MEKYNGYVVKKYKDNNIYSLTYGSEKTDMEYNPTICPPDTPAPTPTPTVKKSQTITWSQDITELYVNESIELVATASSNLSVTFSIQEGGTIAHLDGNTLYADKEGGIVVVANQAGNDEYYAADTVLKTISLKVQPTPIEKKDQTINWNQVIDLTEGEAVELTATSTSGLTVQYSLVSGSAYAILNGTTLKGTASGDIVVRAYQTGNDEYKAATPIDKSITVQKKSEPTPSKKAQSITWSQDINVKVGDTLTLNASASSGLDVSYAVIYGNERATISGNTLTCVSEGSVIVNATQSGNDEYAAAATVQKAFTISAKESGGNGGYLVLTFNKSLWDVSKLTDKSFSVNMEQNGELTELWGVDDLEAYLNTFSTDDVTKMIAFNKPSGDIRHQLLSSRQTHNHTQMNFIVKEVYFQMNNGKLIDLENVKIFSDAFADLFNATTVFKKGSGNIFTNTSQITPYTNIFQNDSNIESIYVDNIDMSNSANYNNLFNQCNKLSYIYFDNTKFNTSASTSNMFNKCGSKVDSVTISMKGTTSAEQAFIKQAWIDSGNDENKLTIVA